MSGWGGGDSIAVLRAEQRADSRPVKNGHHPAVRGFFKGTAADRWVSTSADCNVTGSLFAFFSEQKSFLAQQY